MMFSVQREVGSYGLCCLSGGASAKEAEHRRHLQERIRRGANVCVHQYLCICIRPCTYTVITEPKRRDSTSQFDALAIKNLTRPALPSECRMRNKLSCIDVAGLWTRSFPWMWWRVRLQQVGVVEHGCRADASGAWHDSVKHVNSRETSPNAMIALDSE